MSSNVASRGFHGRANISDVVRVLKMRVYVYSNKRLVILDLTFGEG